ncbi:MAG: 2-hydroxyacyl-CoA dehydratase [Firmicutes bacterium]|nr:2-hydroxyacyl-CoA dehydratase [Bacillota bacterium]
MDTIKKDYAKFTKGMKKTHTILVPNMLPVHFELILSLFEQKGYKFEILKSADPALIETGLKYVHNDICYPCLLVIGQFIDALLSGRYDLSKIALAITQTGGGCRASNYIHLLRIALKNAGLSHIPVLSINFSGMEKENSLKFSLSNLKRARGAIVYSDMLYMLANHYKSYEVNKGDTEKLLSHWTNKLKPMLKNTKYKTTKRVLGEIYRDFNYIKVDYVPKIRVGIVGEIYVKYSSLGNNNLEEFLRGEDCETVVPGLMGFVTYCMANNVFDAKFYGRGKLMGLVYRLILKSLDKWELLIKEAAGGDPRFCAPSGHRHLFKLTEGIIDLGVKMGEGWLLPAEMAELAEAGIPDIVCAQPFGCLPNHICGKSAIKRVKDLYPAANITPIDYDSSATRVNQENRIKLMLAVAKERLTADEAVTEQNKVKNNAKGTKKQEKLVV